MSEAIVEINSTRDYSILVNEKGNRSLNEPHVRRLMTSMEKKFLISPILVNEKFQVIDGRHRLEAMQRLKLETKYISVPGYGLEEIQLLNTNLKNWSITDFTEAYVELDIKAYILYQKFKDNYNFNHSVALVLLSGTGLENKSIFQEFRDGLFEIGDYAAADRSAEILYELEPYLYFFKARNFVLAYLKALATECFKHTEFLKRLARGKRVPRCMTVREYVREIEDVYNFGVMNKIRLD